MRMLVECSVGGINSTDPQMAINFEDKNAGGVLPQQFCKHVSTTFVSTVSQVRETPRVTLDLPDSSSHLHYPQIVLRTFTTTQSFPADLPLASLCAGYYEICLPYLLKRTEMITCV